MSTPHDEPTYTGLEFRELLLRGITECRDAGYNPSAFRIMIDRYGAVEAVRRLLRPPVEGVSEGFTRLLLIQRPDLAVEYVVTVDQRCWPLFTEDEREIARQRLVLYEVEPAGGAG